MKTTAADDDSLGVEDRSHSKPDRSVALCQKAMGQADEPYPDVSWQLIARPVNPS